jgi:hypothetical protein
VKWESKLDQHSEGKHQQGLVRLQEQQGQELKQLKLEQHQRASARAQWEQEAVAAPAGGSAQGGAGQLPTAGGGAGTSFNQGTQQQQQGQPHNGGSAAVPGVKLEPVDQDQGAREDTPEGVFVGTAVRRKFPGYGWYDGVVRRARSAGTSVEFEVEWEDGSRAWIKQGDAEKYAVRYAQGASAGAGAGAGAGRGEGSGASSSF